MTRINAFALVGLLSGLAAGPAFAQDRGLDQNPDFNNFSAALEAREVVSATPQNTDGGAAAVAALSAMSVQPAGLGGELRTGAAPVAPGSAASAPLSPELANTLGVNEPASYLTASSRAAEPSASLVQALLGSPVSAVSAEARGSEGPVPTPGR